MTQTRSRTRFVLTALAAVLSLGLLASPAYAIHGNDPPAEPTTNPLPTTTSGDTSDDGTPYTGTAGGCSVVSTSTFLGAHCANGGLAGLKSIKKILAGEEFHRCWYDQMTAEEHQTTGYEDSDEFVWYMHRCITGIDPKTLDVTGPIGISEEYPVKFQRGDTIVTLGPKQAAFVDPFSAQIPYPIAVTSPTSQPRVGGWLSFADGSATHEVVVRALGVLLTAHQDQIIVKPMGAAFAATKTCPGAGHVAEKGETPVPGGSCWYRYTRSSADQAGNTFPVRISAHWTVTQTVGGETRTINQFTKSQITRIPVTEIEAINVS